MITIKEQKAGKLDEADRLELARLLVKAGYRVAIRKVKPEGKQRALVMIEVDGGDNND